MPRSTFDDHDDDDRQAREDVQRRIAEQRAADGSTGRVNGAPADGGAYADILDDAHDELRPFEPGRGDA